MFYFYCFCIVDEEILVIYLDVIWVKERGVLFDVGYGQGFFGWIVVEICVCFNFYFDMISIDLYMGNYWGFVYDLLIVMFKFLYLGLLIDQN